MSERYFVDHTCEQCPIDAQPVRIEYAWNKGPAATGGGRLPEGWARVTVVTQTATNPTTKSKVVCGDCLAQIPAWARP